MRSPALPVPQILAAACALIPLGTGAGWQSPVPHSSIRSGFEAAEAFGSGHRGVDLPAQPGTTILAVAVATVVLARQVAGKPVVVLLVDDTDLGRVRVTYEPVLPLAAAGTRVIAGQPIGTLAATGGHCGRTPHCLHLGIKRDGRYLDPGPFIPTGRIVLKPSRMLKD